MSKLRVLIQSNSSRVVTGFGKAIKNLLIHFHNDPNIELIEAANGALVNADLKTPWESYGTYPNDPALIAQVKGSPEKERAAAYGFYAIDEIVQKVKPDVFIGVEDIWAFNEYPTKPWWGKIPCIIWTTLDSLPILPTAEQMAPKCDKFFVWASFAEEAMKKKGFDNVKTLHGPVNYENFYPLPSDQRDEVRRKNGFANDYEFLIGFVFKNQLRKSAPNLLEGFKRFLAKNPTSDAKLLLHTDWGEKNLGWDLSKYIAEKEIDPDRVVTTYICKSCREYTIAPYTGEELPCPHCGHDKGLVTKNVSFGVTEAQLNEIYNMMDVYCHPFTSGGQELPIQEAKAAGVITLVTDYSCGTDSVGEGTGGIPLKWVEYREPHTDFIKATTLPDSICEELETVWNNPFRTKPLVSEGLEYIHSNYSVRAIATKLKQELMEFPKTDYDFDFNHKPYDVEYTPIETEDDEEWLLDVYKGVAFKELSPLDPEIQTGLKLIKNDGRDKVLGFIRAGAQKKNEQKAAQPTRMEDILGDEGWQDRIAVVIPESAGDVLMVNSLLHNLQELYPTKNIYVVTKPEFFCMIEDNSAVYKCLPYQKEFDSLLLLEGSGDHEGYFSMAFLPFLETQRVLGYLHNGQDCNSLGIWDDLV